MRDGADRGRAFGPAAGGCSTCWHWRLHRRWRCPDARYRPGRSATGAAGTVVLRRCGVLIVPRCRGDVCGAPERLARGWPVLAAPALVSLAALPAGPALAIACIAVASGSADSRSPIGRRCCAGPLIRPPTRSRSTQPSRRAPTSRPRSSWPRSSAGGRSRGAVLPVRRTDANYLSGDGTVTVPALGVPAAARDPWVADERRFRAPERARRDSHRAAPCGSLDRRFRPTRSGCRCELPRRAFRSR